MAPEIVQKREFHGSCADIWALGILLHTFLAGCFPFKVSLVDILYEVDAFVSLRGPLTRSYIGRLLEECSMCQATFPTKPNRSFAGYCGETLISDRPFT